MGNPVQVVRREDFLSYASGLELLFQRGIISRSEARQALREWGMHLDPHDPVTGVIDKYGLVDRSSP